MTAILLMVKFLPTEHFYTGFIGRLIFWCHTLVLGLGVTISILLLVQVLVVFAGKLASSQIVGLNSFKWLIFMYNNF